MSSSQIYGLIGYPVKHSFSGIMHNAAFRALNIDAEYRLFPIRPAELESFLLDPDKEVEDTEGVLVNAQDIIGFNITVPHKVSAFNILHQKYGCSQSSYVRLSGAINTVKREEKGMSRCNTDPIGFSSSLVQDLHFTITHSKKALVLGCGGAARAVISSLSWQDQKEGIGKIYIYDIQPGTADQLKEHYSKFPEIKDLIHVVSQVHIADVTRECDLLVNTTPVGMKETDGCVIDPDLLHKDLFVYDVVYNRDTELVKAAKRKNIPACGGLGMLLYQGVAAFGFWTQQDPPVELMREELIKAVNK